MRGSPLTLVPAASNKVEKARREREPLAFRPESPTTHPRTAVGPRRGRFQTFPNVLRSRAEHAGNPRAFAPPW